MGEQRRAASGLTERRVGELFVDDGGEDGLPVVFVHSLAGNATQWEAQLDHLRPTRRALAFDLRGHGRSAPPDDGSYTVSAYAEDLAAVADGAELDRFVLVGHSMGAAVALAYAASRPGRVAGLLLVDGAHVREETSPDEEAWVASLAGDEYRVLIEEFWEEILVGSPPAVRERVLADLRETPRETVARSFAALLSHDPLPDARRYPGPGLLVRSEVGDTPTALHRHVENLTHVLVDSTGHWLHMDRPDTFNEILDRFLELAEAEST